MWSVVYIDQQELQIYYYTWNNFSLYNTLKNSLNNLKIIILASVMVWFGADMCNVSFKNPFKNRLLFESGFFFFSLTAAAFKCKIISKACERWIKVLRKLRKHSQKPMTVVQLSGGPRVQWYFQVFPVVASGRNRLAWDETAQPKEPSLPSSNQGVGS